MAVSPPKFMTEETRQIGEAETQKAELVRLPLWRNCADAMRAGGISYGKTYPTEYFEEQLRCNRDSLQFGIAISEIRHDLETSGFFLCGRGQKGKQLVVVPAASNSDVMASYARLATRALRRGVILGTNTPLTALSAEERRRHESMNEKLAMRLVFVQKTAQVLKAVQKADPSVLRIVDKKAA